MASRLYVASSLSRYAKGIPINGSNVSLIRSPANYFKCLKDQIQSATNRILISSLYLGTGSREKELVAAIQRALRDNPSLQCTVVLDYLRGNRGSPNSVTMFRPIMDSHPHQFHLHMYHTPQLRGLRKKILPERFNEIIGLQHTKLNIIDDNVLLTGANLSEDYFTNRQDRYIIFNSSPGLADYLAAVHDVICRHSFTVTSDGSVHNPSATPTFNPLSSKEISLRYEESLRRAVLGLIEPVTSTDNIGTSNDNIGTSNDNIGTSANNIGTSASNIGTSASNIGTSASNIGTSASNIGTSASNIGTSASNIGTSASNIGTSASNIGTSANNIGTSTNNMGTSADYDTLVYPLIQVGYCGIRQDELVTQQLLSDTELRSQSYLASGYFNLPKTYKDAILNAKGSFNVLASSPQCMGFYNAEGVAKYIPYMYIHLATRFLKQIKAHDKEDDIKYKEYYRSDWTYHCKGLWYYPPDEEHPLLTLIGSSNYGQRSLIRDLECQVAMVTQSTSLRKSLHEECSGLFEHGKDVSLRQIENNPQRKLPLWVWLTTVLFDSYV